ncbi:MAG: amidohydrolase family protein [Myxococcota bacterium]
MSEFDVLIRGGTVVDGTRFPAFTADVGIRDGRIAAIGRLAGASATRELDADGLVVAPGFVDLHTHYDAQIQWDPWCSISGWHGVTSVALGNCGFGFAPVHPEQRDRAMLTMSRLEAIPLASMEAGMLWDWESFPEWLDTLGRIPKGVNCLSYVPLAPLMTYVMGLENAKQRAATPDEMGTMLRLLGESLDVGALGWSVQRTGTSSIQCDFDGSPMVTDTMSAEDLLAFAGALGARGEGFIQLTNATGDLPKDLALCEEVAAKSGKPVLFNVVVAVTEMPWVHKMFVDWLAACQAKGLRMFGQANSIRAPFRLTLADWNLFDSSPAWRRVLTGTREEKLAKLADPELRQAMAAEADAGLLQTVLLGGPPAGFAFEGTRNAPELDRWIGLRVEEIAKEMGVHPVEAILQLALASDLEATFLTQSITSDDPTFVAELLASPYVIPGVSDGGAHTKFLTAGSYTTDMLSWLVRDEKRMTLEDAHYKLSYLPARAAGFKNRGALLEGWPADVVVYDLPRLRRVPEWWDSEVVHDFPGGEWRRVQRAEGYHWTLVNGEITFEGQRCTGATPGRLLRHGAA